MRISRRDFLKTASAAGVGMMIPGVGSAAGHAARAVDWGKVLVLVELDGGNDGLNTVIPYDVSHYIDRRGGLASGLRYVAGDITTAGTYLGTAPYHTQNSGGGTDIGTQPFGLNPGMTELMAAWNADDLAIIHGVGYDEPNLSHFRGMDIMNSGSDSDELLYDGWLGRVMAANSPPAGLTTQAVITGRYNSNPMSKAGLRYLAMSKPENFIERSLGLRDSDPAPIINNPEFKHLLTVQRDVYNAAGQFRRAFVTPIAPNTYDTIDSKSDYTFTPPTFTNAASFNLDSKFEEQCLYVAQMIVTAANADASKRLQIPVYKLSISGFDNHSGQKAYHQDLLSQVASGLAGLRAAIKQYGDALWDKVVVMTYSEFGRRAEQNGSAGTDHGSASCNFMLGGSVNGGFYGRQPGLKPRPAWNSPANVYDLDTRWNLKATVDYRHLYNKAVTWMGLTPDAQIASPPEIIGGAGADPLAGILP